MQNPHSDRDSSHSFLHLVRALHSRNYRLYFGGQSISLIGGWMTRTATWWLVWQLTNSAFMVGVISFVSFAPAFFMGPIAGVWIDRIDRHRLLVLTQFLSMVQSLALAAIAFASLDVNLTLILLIAFCGFQGFISAFDNPARAVFVVDMVKNPEDMSNAIALNSSMVSLARMIGPSAAGIAVALVGEGWCFLIDGISYIAIIGSLLAMRVSPHEKHVVTKSTFEEMREGWHYVRSFPPVCMALTMMCITNLAGMSYQVLLPTFASKMLGGNSTTYGFLLAFSAIGALSGTIILAARHNILGLDKQIFITTTILGAGLILFSTIRYLGLALPLIIAVGLGATLSQISCNTLLQTVSNEGKRGRVMSFYSTAQMGMSAIGGLAAGALSSLIGVQASLAICGFCCIAGALWFGNAIPKLRRNAYRAYLTKGGVKIAPL